MKKRAQYCLEKYLRVLFLAVFIVKIKNKIVQKNVNINNISP